MTTAILIEALRKTYSRGWRKPAKEALKGISLQIEEGETFGFIGPNGAGKSTLIKILVGVLNSSAGNVSIFGGAANDPTARKGLGFVPENPGLQDYLTPYEIMLMGLRLHGVRVADERKHCLHWLERFDLAAVANTPLRGFSKGMLQRTALAHALSIQPRLLILDEPLSGLDPVGRKDVVDILAEYRGQGGTIFLTSHVLHDVERLADRFGLIHQGELKALQSPNDLVQNEQFVTVRCLGEGVPSGFTPETGGRWFREVERQSLWDVLRQLEASGHILLEVRPTLTLERVFMGLVSGGTEV